MAKIFIIDDCTLITKLYSDYLVAHGHEVQCFNSPFGVTVQMKKETPDLILIDYSMPALNGSELLKLMRKNGTFRAILISGSNREEIAALKTEGVCDDFFVKGEELGLLLEKVNRLAG